MINDGVFEAALFAGKTEKASSKENQLSSLFLESTVAAVPVVTKAVEVFNVLADWRWLGREDMSILLFESAPLLFPEWRSELFGKAPSMSSLSSSGNLEIPERVRGLLLLLALLFKVVVYRNDLPWFRLLFLR
jgi:hypothetical protein